MFKLISTVIQNSIRGSDYRRPLGRWMLNKNRGQLEYAVDLATSDNCGISTTKVKNKFNIKSRDYTVRSNDWKISKK